MGLLVSKVAEMVAELYVDLAVVLFALSHCDRTGQCLALLYVVGSVNVEYYVLPVSVGSVWGCAESYWVFEVFELAVEPGDDRAGGGALLELKLVLRREVDVCLLHVDEVEVNNLIGIAADHFEAVIVPERI